MDISIKRFVEVSRLLLVKLKIENRRGEVSDEKYKKYTYDINKLLNSHFGALEIKKVTANQIEMSLTTCVLAKGVATVPLNLYHTPH